MSEVRALYPIIFPVFIDLCHESEELVLGRVVSKGPQARPAVDLFINCNMAHSTLFVHCPNWTLLAGFLALDSTKKSF